MRKLLRIVVSFFPNIFKISAYRMMGMEIGKGVRIGAGTLLLCERVELMDGAKIGRFCLLRAQMLRMGKRADIGNMVKLSANTLIMKSQSTICSFNEIAGDIGDRRCTLHLGPCSWILQHCYINLARQIFLGKNVGVGGGSYLFTHGLWLSKLDGFPISYGEIRIEDDVWLPWDCFLLPNVTIGSKAVIGARSLINRSIPGGVLAAGIPAKVIREKSYADLTSEDRCNILSELTESYGIKLGRKTHIEKSPELDLHFLGDALLLAIHKMDHGKFSPLPALNVVFSELDVQKASGFCVWSLANYVSTAYAEMPRQARDWFLHARTVGVRFYPIDEDLN